MPEINLPNGFQIDVLTDDVPNARSLALGEEMIFVSTRSEGSIYAVTNYQDDPQVVVIAEGLYMPNGIAFHEGNLYVAEIHRVLKFTEHRLPLFFDSNGSSEEGYETKNFMELVSNDSVLSRSELQWRISPPIALMILVFLAVPLSKSSPREGQYGGLVIGVLIYLVYVNLLGAAKVWFEQGDSPLELGIWWVHGCFAVFLIVYSYLKSGVSRIGR